MVLPEVAIGAIVAAMISAMVVFLTTLLSKEQKTSEFRQSWIDDFRSEMSEFVANAGEHVAMASYLTTQPLDVKQKYLAENMPMFQRMKALEYALLLRLNPDEHSRLSALIRSYIQDLHNDFAAKEVGSGRGEAISTHLLQETQKMLRYEWKRVKQGEPAFRWTKYLSLITLLGIALWWIGSVVGMWYFLCRFFCFF